MNPVGIKLRHKNNLSAANLHTIELSGHTMLQSVHEILIEKYETSTFEIPIGF